MNENEAIGWLREQLKFGVKPGLERVKLLLNKLDNPEKELKIIHIAGTNGKGSTLSYLKNMLEDHDFSVGTFTSPYVEIFNERMSIDGNPIPGEQLVKYVKMLQPLCEEVAETSYGKPTEFEIITCIALKYFEDQQVDYVILETGLGGRLDSTNVVAPLLSIITMIGYDHMDVLGDTIEEIAYEKAGIIKPQTPIITNEVKTNAYQVLENKAVQCNSPIFNLHKDFSYEWHVSLPNGERFTFKSPQVSIPNLTISMRGKHQIENATLAIYSFKKISELAGFSISVEKLIKSIEQTTWVGRYEVIHRKPTIILDGAHNSEAVEQLIETINKRHHPSQVRLLISIIKGKPIEPILNKLYKNYRHITIAPFEFSKSYSKKELLQKFYKCDIIVSEYWKSTIDEFKKQQETNEVLVVTGSLYFISEVRNYLKERSS